MKWRVAVAISGLPFGKVRFALCIYFFASLHISSNQGARVLPSLFGLLGSVTLICFTTPISSAYYSMYSSTSCALSSLDFAVLLIFCLKPSIKVSVYVCADHVAELLPYS